MQPNKNPADQLMPESPIKVEAVQYSADELSTRGDYIRRLQLMWFEREMKHPELDGMTYLEWYDSNRKKDLSYIPPKKTKDDIRIVTGTTREKDTSLLATLLNMNVEPQIHAFDEDNMVVSELGTNVADLVKKSRHIEDWDKKRSNIYREMIAQGDVFVEEIFREEFQDIPIDQLDWDPTKNTISELSFKTRLQKVYSGCEVRMVNGKKVLLGSVRIEHIEDQDIVAIITSTRITKKTSSSTRRNQSVVKGTKVHNGYTYTAKRQSLVTKLLILAANKLNITLWQ